ncbi:GFA family protein [Corallococcus interemptor]|uniref:GFA family protein n=1 Tax=Corallococcus interemptor TaxID=2316720 RepID=UPI003D03805A
MPEKNDVIRTATCACGQVELEGRGPPIIHVECFCADCQEGGRRIEALPDAPSPRGPLGGTDFILYRKDRLRVSRGESLLSGFKLKDASPTKRLVATCCNSGMYMDMGSGPHWYSVYGNRFTGEVPPLELRTCTRYKPAGVELPNDVPNHPSFLSVRFMTKLFLAWIPMLLKR